MATVWLSRFVQMCGTRRLFGSFNLGSMANAMPQALGREALDRARQVVAFCGDGGLTMLMGDLITAVTYELPVKLVVFDNRRLGMVKLEKEQVGLPEYGTVLHNPDFAKVAEAIGMRGIRVERPDDVAGAVREVLAHDGPVLLDVLTNPDEISVRPRPPWTRRGASRSPRPASSSTAPNRARPLHRLPGCCGERNLPRSGRDLDRYLTFVDAVVAIAITPGAAAGRGCGRDRRRLRRRPAAGQRGQDARVPAQLPRHRPAVVCPAPHREQSGGPGPVGDPP